MLNTMIITILIYSAITFLISAFADNEDVDRVLAWSVVGMAVWSILYPLRQYMSSGFYVCEFSKENEESIIVYIRGGNDSYKKLKEKYHEEEYECVCRKIWFNQYFKEKYITR